MNHNAYVLITPVRNEEAYIEKTVKSVISQTVLPKKWVIVNDGSTDRTEDIVRKYSAEHDFIQLLHLETAAHRNFASKVHCIQAGYEQLRDMEYQFLGILDGDVSFEPNYYESMLAKFDENSKLGIAGGIIYENCGGNFRRQFASLDSVAGPIQLFRHKCYEEIAGYIPLKYGGVDAVAEIMARMKGWHTRSFEEAKVLHYRLTGSQKKNTKSGILLARFRQGVKEYSYGSHPLFEIAKCIHRTTEMPYFLSSIFRMSGYCWAFLHRIQRDLPDNVIKYLRKEQLQRLRQVTTKWAS